jgi:hypothetical protein
MSSTTEEFRQRVEAIDRARLKVYLQALTSPCFESELLRVAFPHLDIAAADALSLYQHHFLLFHLLYQVQDEFFQEGQYLFVHFMRTMLVPYPEPGACRFFEERLGHFCRAACQPGQEYCDLHHAMLGDSALEALSIKYFYLDPHNFYRLDADTAQAFIEGSWEILTHYDEYQKSFDILGLPQTADLRMVKKRFKRLAKVYHPDRGAPSNEKFHEINNAYRLVVQIHSVMQGLNTAMTE